MRFAKRSIDVDNPTDYVVDLILRSDYGFEIYWNARKGKAELLRAEYIHSLKGAVQSFRSSRNAEIVTQALNILPLLNAPFLIIVTYRNCYYNLLFDGSGIIVRDYDIDRDML